MELSDLPTLVERLRAGVDLSGARVENLDLTSVEADLLARTDLAGLVVLGGRVSPRLAAHLTAHGAIVFPTDPHAPVDVYRAHLYSPTDLYAGIEDGYETTPDARTYAWTLDAAANGDHYVSVLRALHDDSIIEALTDTTDTLPPLVGVMGGHAVERGTPGYRDAVLLGRALARAGRVVVTGGGPGAMEAANLGALATSLADDALDAVLTRLASVPSFHPSVAAWARVALDELPGLLDDQVRSLGVPTWFYGHEPPNVFCDGIAKLFSNALREDVLLDGCRAGIVVLPGAAGTVQEIFQASTRLYYAADGPLPPLVLVGREHWTSIVPAWPLLASLAAGRPMARAIHLVDTPEQAAAVIG